MIIRNKLRKTLLTAIPATLILAGAVCMAASSNGPAEMFADTMEYDSKSGMVVATGNVRYVQQDTTITGSRAEYNINTKSGAVTGGVVATKGDGTSFKADQVTAEGDDHFIAVGNVNGRKDDKTFTGPRVEYFSQEERMVIPTGGTITGTDGTFTADYMEGWMKEEHYHGTGNVHVVSPPRKLEAGGDDIDYLGKEEGKAVLTGNAWAIQDNNTLKSNRLVIYLAEDGQAGVK